MSLPRANRRARPCPRTADSFWKQDSAFLAWAYARKTDAARHSEQSGLILVRTCLGLEHLGRLLRRGVFSGSMPSTAPRLSSMGADPFAVHWKNIIPGELSQGTVRKIALNVRYVWRLYVVVRLAGC